MLQRLLYAAVTVAVGWAVYYFLLARLARGPEQVWVFLPVWLILAYALLPRVHKILSSLYIPDYFIGRTRTGDGVLGDPVNVAVIGPADELRQAMTTAGWVEADPLTPATAWRTLESTVLGRSYPAAPVSWLYVFGNRQDMAFQREIDGNPRKRHHVRFWKCPDGWMLPGGIAVDWVGAGTYDRSVGLSLFTFQITHKIADHTDEERDFIIETLRAANAGGISACHQELLYRLPPPQRWWRLYPHRRPPSDHRSEFCRPASDPVRLTPAALLDTKEAQPSPAGFPRGIDTEGPKPTMVPISAP
ncbi:LssY C-terminal domain-containing protein [Arthrobacter sp. ISL-28]|uniref:LssY C-terminal domain-containing protein n=1 Tax=Arthrobacter sp. ISL-28 TaxID=2819108 RepID=UPI00288C142B|nr:LssY C-terminal domain-containing protein [Arthrobacter sp. ISL-28]